MNKKLLSLLLSVVLVISLFAGCANKGETPPTVSSPPPPTQNTPSAPSSSSTPETPEVPTTVMFTDSVGREVEVLTNITRVSPSGSLAQMFLLAIAPDLLVTTASEYTAEELVYLPDNIAGLPFIGQFYGVENLNFESIASLEPEIIIDVGDPKKTIVEDMDGITTNLAVPAVHITATLDSSPDAFRMLGKLLNREEKGEELAAYCEGVLYQTEAIMAKVGENKRSVLYCLGDAGLNVLAASSFHSEILDYITDNRAVVDEPSSRGSGNETDHEQLLMWDPEVLLFAPNSVYAAAADDVVWQQMQAIAAGTYYEVPYGPYNWMGSPPAINRYLGMLWLSTLLYPEHADFDLCSTVTEYYKLFYGHTLTQAEYDALIKNSLPAANG